MYISGQPFYKYLPSKHLPLTPIIEYTKHNNMMPKKTPGPCIKHAHKCGGTKPVDGIHNLPLLIIGSLTAGRNKQFRLHLKKTTHYHKHDYIIDLESTIAGRC